MWLTFNFQKMQNKFLTNYEPQWRHTINFDTNCFFFKFNEQEDDVTKRFNIQRAARNEMHNEK